MKQVIIAVFCLSVLLTVLGQAFGQDLDIVTLEDGSILHGEILEMTDGTLRIKTGFTTEETVSIKWADVKSLTLNRPLPFHLQEGTILHGTAMKGEDGMLHILAEPLSEPVVIPLSSVIGLNPPILPAVVYQGNVTLGYAKTTGNTDTESFTLLGEVVARSERLRLSLLGRYILSEQSGSLTARNARGTIKLDFFLTKRFYLFTSAFFEQDTFQDLKLRTALSAGPGYQFIDVGDFSGPRFHFMQLYAEAGLAYFNEDFKVQPDTDSVRARLSVKWDWPIIKDKLTLFHYNEIFPSVEDTSDYYITTDQGIIFGLIENWVTKIQISWRYNNKPPPLIKASDTLFPLYSGV